MRNLKVVGLTDEGKSVAGELLYGKFKGKEKVYFVKTFDNAIIACSQCSDDKPIE